MSRDAVKFGRMSKKQRDRLQAEVLEQLEKREKNREKTGNKLGNNGNKPGNNGNKPGNTGNKPGNNGNKAGKREKREEERAAPGPSLPPPAGRCPPLSPAVPAGCPSRAWPAEEVTKRGQDGDKEGTAGTGPIPQPGAGGVPESPAGLEIELLTQSVLLSHRATCHPRTEDLQGHHWATFSPEEIRAYQSQPMAEMWQRCARRVTEAIERVVEFAKRLRGFLQLSQHDQIVLLKAGAMEVVLLRMCRAFDAATGTVLFEGKLAGPELFRSLGCPELVASVFDFARGLSALRCSESELALLSALLLLNAGQPLSPSVPKCPQVSPQRPHPLSRSVSPCLPVPPHALPKPTGFVPKQGGQRGVPRVSPSRVPGCPSRVPTRVPAVTAVSPQLPAPGRLRALCSQHLEQVQAFRRLHPAGVSAAFPPLYRELFAPDPADGPAGTR
ncbi:nuclear receptor ROR-gamma-like [Serinus canaria]|uniref:nuclear receptor ROR-gamma-like n=1 Tax=Serinus canaria TaxID=9135 RepID=UPI0021CCD955|nr:nuclear receptor ROR-gamma-like [Serinus canaria]